MTTYKCTKRTQQNCLLKRMKRRSASTQHPERAITRKTEGPVFETKMWSLGDGGENVIGKREEESLHLN